MSSSAFVLTDGGLPLTVPAKSRSHFDRAYADRLPRYCNLSSEQWLDEVRYYPVSPLGRGRTTQSLWLAVYLCLMMAMWMTLYSAALLRFVFGGGVGLVPLVTSQLAYTPNITYHNSSQYHFVSGRAQWNQFGYAEVVTIETSDYNVSSSASTDGQQLQYAQSSDIGGCSYTVTDVVTGLDPPSWRNDGKYAPQGSSQLTLHTPACSALTAAFVCSIALVVLTVFTGFPLLFASVFGDYSAQQALLDELQLDLRGTADDATLSQRQRSDGQWWKDIPDKTPHPARAALPTQQEMLDYVRERMASSKSTRGFRMCLLGFLCTTTAIMDVFAWLR